MSSSTSCMAFIIFSNCVSCSKPHTFQCMFGFCLVAYSFAAGKCCYQDGCSPEDLDSNAVVMIEAGSRGLSVELSVENQVKELELVSERPFL